MAEKGRANWVSLCLSGNECTALQDLVEVANEKIELLKVDPQGLRCDTLMAWQRRIVLGQ